MQWLSFISNTAPTNSTIWNKNSMFLGKNLWKKRRRKNQAKMRKKTATQRMLFIKIKM